MAALGEAEDHAETPVLPDARRIARNEWHRRLVCEFPFPFQTTSHIRRVNVDCRPIGFVKSPVTAGADEGWGSVSSEVVIDEQYALGLKGIDSFFHIIVVFEMHKSSRNAETDLVRRPQGRPDMPLVGIFAQRAKHRPNPIGVTTVRLLAVKGSTLRDCQEITSAFSLRR